MPFAWGHAPLRCFVYNHFVLLGALLKKCIKFISVPEIISNNLSIRLRVLACSKNLVNNNKRSCCWKCCSSRLVIQLFSLIILDITQSMNINNDLRSTLKQMVSLSSFKVRTVATSLDQQRCMEKNKLFLAAVTQLNFHLDCDEH